MLRVTQVESKRAEILALLAMKHVLIAEMLACMVLTDERGQKTSRALELGGV